MRTTTVAQIRAEHIMVDYWIKHQGASLGAPWQWVYSVTRGQGGSVDGDDNADHLAGRLDDRYVVLRLSKDRRLRATAPEGRGLTVEGEPHRSVEPLIDNYEDEYVVALVSDLWDVQVISDAPIPREENAS